MKEEFGKQLELARKASGYTQKELAKKVGLKGNSIYRIEKGRQGIAFLEMLQRLMAELGQPPAYFFETGRMPERPPQPKIPPKLELLGLAASLDEAEATALLPILQGELANLRGDKLPSESHEVDDQPSAETDRAVKKTK